MSQQQWVKLIGFIVILIPVIETITGVAWEKTGLVRRCDKPGLYWFSVICKFIVGLAIINLEYLRARFGA
jgi:hypothetical protein